MASKWMLSLFQLIISLHLANADLPAVFIFGDSILDVGTNNYLKDCLATADNPHYGIDYPDSKPTGRFSNGYNTADSLVQVLGDFNESPPPFLYLAQDMHSFKSNILHGVNFASGGSGISNETGFRAYRNVVYLGQQIQQFGTVCDNITQIFGPAKARSLLANSLYIISAGSNDLFDMFRFGSNLSDPLIIPNLHNLYANHLERLYKMGARKFAILSIPPIGCVPAMLAHTGGSCMTKLNDLARAFYCSTQDLLQQFSSSFTGVKYSLGDVYRMTMDMITKTKVFINTKDACCGVGAFNGKDKCKPESKVCTNRSRFLFFDWFHPTQFASQLAALELALETRSEYVTPMNFHQLASIDIRD